MRDFVSSSKKIYDPVHSFIKFDDFERELIDSFIFQRLHHIRQLGVTYLVYPGATQSRFEHSLGVMEIASRIFDQICKECRPDVFHYVPRKGSAEYIYWKEILRMAALCHDLGHLPFSHAAEADLLGPEGHEEMTLKIIESDMLKTVWNKLKEKLGFQKIFSDRNFIDDITKVAIGECKLQELRPNRYPFSHWEKIVAECISGDFFGADRIDYLLRDARSTGIAYGLFDYNQLIESLRILPSKEKDELELGINESGIEACEALVLARHFMRKRVYMHPSVKAFTFHVRRFMKGLYSKEALLSLDYFASQTDASVICALYKAAKDNQHSGYSDAIKLLSRSNPLKAICLSGCDKKSILEDFKTKQGLSNEQIAWEVKESEGPGTSFSVAREHLHIQPISECSSLLKTIPALGETWVYISSEYEALLLQTVNN